MSTAVLSAGTAWIAAKLTGLAYTALVTGGGSSGLAYTASVTDDGSSALGEPPSLAAYAAAENITVCQTSKTARQKDSTALPTLRFRFNTKISSTPQIPENFGDSRIIWPI
ncbi:hypothetical protein [Paenibacillus sp. A3]|uniref:hypothetical protein n=1 Tax=Paenibacillus sp. A3 TaxID=1337054 RepID=UPI00138F4FD3|nr:hypothetical protein [Paenibacillus sp. A3]